MVQVCRCSDAGSRVRVLRAQVQVHRPSVQVQVHKCTGAWCRCAGAQVLRYEHAGAGAQVHGAGAQGKCSGAGVQVHRCSGAGAQVRRCAAAGSKQGRRLHDTGLHAWVPSFAH